jgi:hypothetical protein
MDMKVLTQKIDKLERAMAKARTKPKEEDVSATH